MSTDLDCTLDFNASPEPQTVGDTGVLSCRGDLTGLDLNSARTVELDAEKKSPGYKIFLLDVKETSDAAASWVVTSYVPGQYRGETITIEVGEKLLKTSPLNWTVNSVLEPGKKPEMAPSVGPYALSYPLWLWLGIAIFALAITGMIIFIWQRGERRRRLYREMDKHMSMLAPFAQFSKDMRALHKEFQHSGKVSSKVVEDLDRIYRLYLLRELKIPALDYNTHEILSDVKKRYRKIYEGHQAHLRRIFFEFDKAKKSAGEVKPEDCEQMFQACRQLADRIHAELRSA